MIGKVHSMNIAVHSVDWETAKIAAGYKKMGGTSYADCFARALAKKMDASLATGDSEFNRLKDQISIQWI